MRDVFICALLGSAIGAIVARIVINARRGAHVDSADVAVALRQDRTQILRDRMVMAIVERAVLRQMDAQLTDIPVEKIADCYDLGGS